MKAFRSLLLVLLVAAAGIFGAQWLGQDSVRALGEVIVRAGDHDYIATLPQAALAVLIAALLVWLLWSLQHSVPRLGTASPQAGPCAPDRWPAGTG